MAKEFEYEDTQKQEARRQASMEVEAGDCVVEADK